MAQKNRISETEWKQLRRKWLPLIIPQTDIGYSVRFVKAGEIIRRSHASRLFQQKISAPLSESGRFVPEHHSLKAENGEPLKLVQVWIPAKASGLKLF
ncbi:ArdK family transcriptional regulator [Escherichia coli]|uniref:ArdK family transcriptional regulator n=1 Tax=Escherichia coli TaxID=562 RepID=A0A9Q9T180_ECOLX|nr:ArdK family transcriptional regulator [Escherichia coli]UYA94314.1 ArdK family transcriptional regulator [Escherichia coli]